MIGDWVRPANVKEPNSGGNKRLQNLNDAFYLIRSILKH